jgi:hypothetical protein
MYLYIFGALGTFSRTGAMYFRYENELAYKWGKYLWERNGGDIETCLNNKTKICRLRVQD